MLCGCCKDTRAAAAEEDVEVSPQSWEPSVSPKELHDSIRVKGCNVKVHNAKLDRSFAQLGWMDPYAIIVLGDSKVECAKTHPAQGAHKTPEWNSNFHISVKDHLPDHITIAVWDKNNFHRDVFCGSTTVPCSPDMCDFDKKEFVLTKNDKNTGKVQISIHLEVEEPEPEVGKETPARKIKRTKSSRAKAGAGPELDAFSAALHSETDHVIELRQGDTWAAQGSKAHGDEPCQLETHNGEARAAEEASPPAAPEPAPPAGKPGQPIVGKWKCVNTWGLDDFLKAQKRSFFERKTAAAAKWPEWEFKFDGDNIVFLNTTMIGLLREDIRLGTEYENVDGQKNKWKVMASWNPSGANGGVLVQDRSGDGPLGQVKEERTVTGDKLEFKLSKGDASWGRSFVRI